jgi:septum formation protein
MVYSDSGIRRLVLASGSPRRRQLLSLLGIPFVVKAADVDERQLAGEAPTELALRVSQAKALAVGSVRSDDLVVAADTIVVLGGKVLGKPVDTQDAARMLVQLRGRAHVVYSGVAVWHPASRRMVSELGESLVWMREYTDGEIAAYVESCDPLDKAGAYAIQHPDFRPVERVEGCWLNVMGLPLCHVARALAGFGVVLPAAVPGACQAFSQRTCTVHHQVLARNQPSDS